METTEYYRGGSEICHCNLFTIHLEKKTANQHLLNFFFFFFGDIKPVENKQQHQEDDG